MMSARRELQAHLRGLFAGDGRPAEELDRLVELMLLLAELEPPPDPEGLYGDYPRLRERLVAATAGSDAELVEERFLELYCHLHGFEAPYTPAERARVDESGGYWCHAGGLSPILKAAPFLGPGSVSADYGAGNGLQGLLLQKLYPHARTVQIEISSRMVAAGRALCGWLGVPVERIEWRVADVRDVPPRGLDFIYLYRPLRPLGPGVAFYRRFAAELAAQPRRTVIFSVADCLADFLPPSFERLYDDGHLRCFRGPDDDRAAGVPRHQRQTSTSGR